MNFVKQNIISATLCLVFLIAIASLISCGGGGGGGSSNGTLNPPPAPPVIKLPQTGQLLSYDTNTVKRDDGALQMGVVGPGTRFVDNTDGTVTDVLTGLMWLKDANCIKTNYPLYDADGTAGDGAVYWQHALMFMSSMPTSSCGGQYSDWRLPNFRELGSLLDYSRPFTMEPAGPFVNIQNSSTSYYWTSTTDMGTGGKLSINVLNGIPSLSIANTDDFVWPVRTGVTTTYASLPKTGQTTSYYSGDDGDYSRGVGAAWPVPRFTAKTDTSIRDNLTGLQWAPNGNLMPSQDANWDQDGVVNDGKVSWQHALDYVALLNTRNYLGHSDWRLPNVIEADSLEHYGYAQETCAGSPCASTAAWLNAQGFTNIQSPLAYWTSTSWAGDPWNYAWFGHSKWLKSSTYAYVWPVR